MTIKNKDGTPYRLSSPNALMKEQRFWNNYTIHNMKWNSTVHKDVSGLSKIDSDFVIRDGFAEELEATKPLVEEPSLQRHEVVIEDKKPIGIIDDGIAKCFVYCLPASVSKKYDSLYDESYVSISYGEPFSIEAVIIDEQDLYINFWTTIDISKDSVVFPKNNRKRWWKVVSIEAKHNGKLYSCAPSSYQPHFEGV